MAVALILLLVALGSVLFHFLSPDDPNGRDDVVIQGGELHLPVGRPVKVLLRSLDVLHDFYVPHFRAKMDMVPGQVTYFWFTPTRVGDFEVLCAELCGVGHAFMRGKVVVDKDSDYQTWLQGQQTFAQLSGELLKRTETREPSKSALDSGGSGLEHKRINTMKLEH